MTDIDTAAIRALIAAKSDPHYTHPIDKAAWDLCDALDATRAERERWEHDYWREVARAEAAEARARHADERCDMHAQDCAEAEAELDEAIARSGAQWKRATDAEARIAYLEGYAAAAVKEHRDAVGRIAAALKSARLIDDPRNVSENICDVISALTGGTE